MLLMPGVIKVIKGPHENRWRPSIDVLFRSAAASYNSKVTGIVLTGLLDDGTAGMSAIKRCGEEFLWVSIRKLEERKRLLEGSADHVGEGNGDEQEKHRLEKAGEMDDHIERLKSLLISLGKNDVVGIGYA